MTRCFIFCVGLGIALVGTLCGPGWEQLGMMIGVPVACLTFVK